MKRLTSLAATIILSACGGGGGDSATTSAPPAAVQSAEGFWIGKTANGTTVNLAVLENGETWGLYGNANSLVGALYGKSSVTGSTISGSGTGFNFVTRVAGNGTYTGTVSSKGNINLSVSDGTQFTGSYDASYEQPATLASYAGTYTGLAVTGTIAPQTTTVVIDATGNLSSSAVSGSLSCTTSGTVTPRASGKNVADLHLTFTGNYCALGNGTTVTGVATYSSATRQVIAMGLNAAKTDGLIFVGTR
jgi:hypothetical protein